jgi:hypothetical protein
MLPSSAAQHRNRFLAKLETRMRRAPRKILYQEEQGTSEENAGGVLLKQKRGGGWTRKWKRQIS